MFESPRYTGTNGIQAADLVTRKLGRDGGAAMEMVLQELRSTVGQLIAADDPRLLVIGEALGAALSEMEGSTQTMLQALSEDRAQALGASFDYLMQTGYLFGGWQMGRSALAALRRLREGSDNPFYEQKISTALFYAEQILPRCAAHAGAVATAAGSLQSYPVDWV